MLTLSAQEITYILSHEQLESSVAKVEAAIRAAISASDSEESIVSLTTGYERYCWGRIAVPPNMPAKPFWTSAFGEFGMPHAHVSKFYGPRLCLP